MAEILGKTEDLRQYRALQSTLKTVYQVNFLHHGSVRSRRACRYVRALSMELVDAANAAQTASALNRRCEARDYTIGTGFLTTWQLLPVLTEFGYADTAYRLLENTKAPGWLYEIKKGATTTWENWLGVDENGVPTDSHNHFAPGAVVSWLFRYCAGIRPLKPGFSEILIQPVPGGSLTWAKAEFESAHGMIRSNWRLADGQFRLEIETPVGIETTVILPDGSKRHTLGGIHRFACPASDAEVNG